MSAETPQPPVEITSQDKDMLWALFDKYPLPQVVALSTHFYRDARGRLDKVQQAAAQLEHEREEASKAVFLAAHEVRVREVLARAGGFLDNYTATFKLSSSRSKVMLREVEMQFAYDKLATPRYRGKRATTPFVIEYLDEHQIACPHYWCEWFLFKLDGGETLFVERDKEGFSRLHYGNKFYRRVNWNIYY